jgi:sugar lactone lactonase YvrE
VSVSTRAAAAVNEVPILGPESIRVLFDGTLSEPRLDHPECVAVDADGVIWCGGERGQVYRLAPDGSSLEEFACSGGFTLGIAFAPNRDLFLCDLKTASVLRLPAGSDRLETFAEGAGGRRFRIPNALAFDADGRLYVSDSHGFKEPGPGIFRFEPDGEGELWCAATFNFANGVAIAPDGRSLLVAETFANRIVRIPIREDGSAGETDVVATLIGFLPDGLAFDAVGNLYVGCYEPSAILRVAPDGVVRALVADPEAHALCHPTNLAFRGRTLLAANLGRWHVSAVELDVEGLPLPPAPRTVA